VAQDLVLVTGATGYVARHCITQLLERGFRVRGTLRSMARAPEAERAIARALKEPELTASLSFMEAQLLNAGDWADTMTGVGYVLHVASPLPATRPKSDDELIAPAREGTLNVMRAAAASGVERVVQTSSAAAICYGCAAPDHRVFTEQDWSDPHHPDNSAYTRSKTLAELAVWETLPTLSRALEWVTINPGLILGPVLDRDASASVQVVAKLLKGEMPGVPRLAWPIVDVRDIADLHIRAMTTPAAAGQRYIGAADFITMFEISQILRRELGAAGAKAPLRRLPDWLVRVVGLVDKEVGGQTFELGKERRLSSAKARSELGWTTRPAKATILDTAASLARVGALA
jgi:nucleoside-diphosphate-sugar epimerase